MQRGTTATVERKDGMKFDVVIEEITADNVTVLRQIGDKVTSETIPISDIARGIKKKSLKKMGAASKVLIVTAVTLGVLFVAALACVLRSPRRMLRLTRVCPANALADGESR